MPKRKRGITGMLPVDGRQLKTKGELLKLKRRKKPPIVNYGTNVQDRRAEETANKRNSRLSDMAQRGQERRAEKKTEEEIDYWQKWDNVTRREEPKKQKNKEKRIRLGNVTFTLAHNIRKKIKIGGGAYENYNKKRLDLKEYLHFLK
ncbi:hypothetical protein AVEN_183253-1 [Araneus ventricosus]|uniref:Uncharacterized protein n=1 Tax=Araneus ventricosus TaxID=182803 RepID=A0A4Y2RC58_ARAVE|nr:hypothetical protein AVEN_183253-1 [Araneus ventricosus]